MHILFITADKRYLEEASEQRVLLKMMSEVAESLHAVVLTKSSLGYTDQKLDEHTWVYSTNSLFEFMYYLDGMRVINRQVLWQDELHADLILSDDAATAGWLGLWVASKYSRAWMVNLHEYYWDRKPNLVELLSSYTVVPLKDLLANAFRVIAFTERVAIYVQSAAETEEEKAKVVVYPEIFTALKPDSARDLKVLYPEFKFIVLHYLPPTGGNLSLALSSVSILHTNYQHCGLVVMTTKQPSYAMLAQVKLANAEAWVRFVVVEPETLPFINANIFLYLNGGEEEDAMLIRTAAAGSTPIVATDSIVSEKILNNNVNGLIIFQANAETIATGIRKLNETPGLRELFQVNSGLLLQRKIVPSREAMAEKLAELLSFQYQEAPGSLAGPEKHLFARLTPHVTYMDRLKMRFNAIKDRYTKL